MTISTAKKFTALFSALVLTVTGFNPAASAYADTVEVSSTVDLTYTRFDIQSLNDAGIKLKNACSKKNNEEEVLSCYQKVFDLYQEYSSALVLSTIEKDVSGNNDEYVYESSINYDVMIAFSEALYYPFFESGYTQLFEENVSSFIRSYVLSIHSETSAISTLDNSTQIELIRKYQDLFQDFYISHLITAEEFEKQAAQIYIDLTKNRKEQLETLYPESDYEEYYYQYYNRDYSTEDIAKEKDSIKKTSTFVYQYCINLLFQILSQYSAEEQVAVLYSNSSQDDYVSDVLIKYSSDISEDVFRSAQFMKDNNLLFTGTSNSTFGGYTTFLLSQDVPVIFVNGQSDRETLKMVIHEFGHFNAFLNSDLSNLLPNSYSPNVDISEVQSQGMEILFWNYYDNIYGDYTELIKAYALYQIAETFVTGFFVNDFESEAAEIIDTITPEELIRLYHEKQNEYGLTEAYQTPFGSVSNYFIQPFYCISYSMSLLPVWELISTAPEERTAAIEKYNTFSKVDALDTNNSFLNSLSDSGFGNILDDNYINSIRKICGDYSDSIEGIINGDLNKDGTVSATDLVMLKKIFLQDMEPDSYNAKQADLNRDGKLTASDLVEMIMKLL